MTEEPLVELECGSCEYTAVLPETAAREACCPSCPGRLGRGAPLRQRGVNLAARPLPGRIPPLSMTLRTENGQELVLAVSPGEGRDSLILQGGLWRHRIPQDEVERACAFLLAHWTPGKIGKL